MYRSLIFCYFIHVVYGANFNGPYEWSLIESTTTPDSPYCFDTDPGDAEVTYDEQPSSTPTLHCITCFGLWKDAGRNQYCLFFTPGTTNKLDYDKANKYRFPVTVENGDDFATIKLTITPDLPPFFTTGSTVATVTTPVDEAVDTAIYTLPVDDIENKAGLIYTMAFTVESDFFYIDNTGDIKIKKNLATLCADSTELVINISDGYNPAIGPMKVQINIDRGGVSYKPIISTKNEIKLVEENTLGDFFFIDGQIVDGGTCIITASPASMSSQYTFNCGAARINALQAKAIDFETTPPVNYTIIYNNGLCDSDPFWYYLTWKDMPEVPKLSIATNTFTVNEGFINILPVYTIVDEDAGNTHQYILESTTTAAITILTSTGALYSPAYFRLSQLASDTETIEVTVQDSAGLISDIVQIEITIRDINDNRPILDPYTTSYTFTDCTPTGYITTLTAQDDDFGVNAEIEFIPLSSGTMSLYNNGELWIKSQPVAGQIDVMTVRAKDNGNPSLTSLSGTISLVGTACPTTPAPPTGAAVTTVAPVTTTSTAAPVTQAASSSGPFDSPGNVALLTIGILVFLLIVVVSAFLIYKFCCKDPGTDMTSRKSNKANAVNPYDRKPRHNWSREETAASESGVDLEDNYGNNFYSKYNFDRGFNKVVGKPSNSAASTKSNIFWTENYSDKSMPTPVRNF